MPLLMAARGEQALALAGKLADGLIISNMCPAEFTQAAVLAMREAAREAQRAEPAEVGQNVPCAVRLDQAQPYSLSTRENREMNTTFWAPVPRRPQDKADLLEARRIPK